MLFACRWIACFGAALIVSFGAVSAQTREQGKIDEIIRKAEGKEPERGFCATTGWPQGDNLESFLTHLQSASVGSWKVSNYASGGCQYDRVTGVHMESGGKCVAYDYWRCLPKEGCGKAKSVDCLDRNGKPAQRR